MLSDQQRTLIKATIPLLESGGETLTTYFYQLMFREHPEVLPLFNPSHQASGAQPRALANSVLMYARHIDHLEALGPLVGQIVHKHAALQVLPEHYPIVGSCLLRSIREVLGAEIATDEILAAWGAAYQQLADILIGAEEALYAEHAKAQGGWRGARRFKVARKVPESAEVTSFYLVPDDQGPLLEAQPGQYLGLRLMLDGKEVRRNYSLSACTDGQQYRISVKRESGGQVSSYLHDQLQVGDSLEVFPPAGDFTLKASEKPLALITGGIGITPALAMLKRACETNRSLYFIHCTRHAGVHAFREEVRQLAEQHPQLTLRYCYSEPQEGDQADAFGLLSTTLLGQWLPAERDIEAYFLGPKAFMAQVKRDLQSLGVPAEQSHYEFFGPAEALMA